MFAALSDLSGQKQWFPKISEKSVHLKRLFGPFGFSACFGLYRFLFAIYGSSRIVSRGRCRRTVQTIFNWIMRSAFVSCFALDIYQNFVHLVQVITFDGTFLTIVEFLYYLTLNVLELESSHIIIFLTTKIHGGGGGPQREIRETRRFFSVRAFIVGVGLSIPLTVKVLFDFHSTVWYLDRFTASVYVCSIFVFFVQVPAFIFYLQCLQKVRSELIRNQEAVQSNRFLASAESIVKSKRHVRETLKAVNGVFKRFVIVKFVSIFCGVTMQVGLSIGESAENGLAETLSGILLDAALKLLEVYVVCRSGTHIERICHETEKALYMKTLRRSAEDARILQRLRRELAYEPDRDSLEMSLKFRINTATLLSFFSTVITCCAVTLQFDSRVVRAINSAGASAREP